jgi:hypothetical protein
MSGSPAMFLTLSNSRVTRTSEKGINTGHSNAKTTGLYDRRNDDISVGEVERIGI